MKFENEKLVRDKIPALISTSGRTPQVRIANSDERMSLLKNKLLEETHEFIETGAIEELADIFQVIHAICREKKITFSTLEEIRHLKLITNGGFDEGIVLKLDPKNG